MRNKVLFVIVIILCITCFSMGVISFSFKNQPVTNTTNKDVSNIVINNNVISDFDKLKYSNSFDVNDFANNKINTIDIRSKWYDSNTITVLDSEFRLSAELEAKMYELINGYGAATSFYIVSLDDGMSIAYNIDRKFQTASSVKAPYALSIAREIAKGNIDKNQLLTYQERHFSIGTGVIKENDFGTQFTVEQLIYYALHESDNVAHIMLHKEFGVKQYNQHMNNIGASALTLAASNPWGFTTARSSALVWQDIYNFAIEDVEGIKFLNILSNGKYNYFKEVMPSIPSASKTGFADYDVVETGIVFDEKPYIAIAIANKGGNIGAYTQVLKMISGMNDIMHEYKDYCNKK